MEPSRLRYLEPKRLTLLESLRCVRLTLWDESEKRLISFRQMRQRVRAAV